MHIAYLEKRNPANNIYRFYTIQITPTLFGDWAVVGLYTQTGQMSHRIPPIPYITYSCLIA